METVINANNKEPQKDASPKEVLNGHDMNQDIHQLLGYVHTHGQIAGASSQFPSEHMQDLAAEFLRKYRPLKHTSPKNMENIAHRLKMYIKDHQNLRLRYESQSEKLSIHEHYMKIIQRMDMGYHTMCSEYSLESCLESFANNYESEAKEWMNKPESFDDITDEWNGNEQKQ